MRLHNCPEAEVLFPLIFDQILCTGKMHDSIGEMAATLARFPRHPFVKWPLFRGLYPPFIGPRLLPDNNVFSSQSSPAADSGMKKNKWLAM